MNTPLARQLDALSTWRRALDHRLRALAAFLSEHELLDGADAAALDGLGRRLAADKLVLACVAEVSRGKSELLNAIFFADVGRRVLPATPGRTTMCPVELQFDARRPTELALLPIDTRLAGHTLADLRATPEAWQRLSLDAGNPDGLAEALNLVTHTRRVDVATAVQLGLWNDEQPQDNPPRGDDGHVEVPAWRHAVINYPHPLLERGLVVIDTPGLNAVGAEPELTLGLLPTAHAVLFLLAADTGVSRSDLATWSEHLVDGARERYVVLNKIDILADPLSTPQAVAAQLDAQRCSIAATLDVPLTRVFALSAREALAARVQGDDAALQRSGLPELEAALAKELLPRRRELLARTALAALQSLRSSSTRRLAERRRHNAEQLIELGALRGKSDAKLRSMQLRLADEAADFERSAARLTALRAVQLRMLHKASSLLSSEHLRDEMGRLHAALDASALRLGARRAFHGFCERLRATLAAAQAQVDEMQQMLGASHRQLNAEFGFALTLGDAPQLAGCVAELDLIERSYSHYLAPTQMWRLAGAGFVAQFERMLLSKLRVAFENAAGELEMWSRSATAQIELQLRERRRSFAQRQEALQRIQSAAGELETRLADLALQDKRLAGLQWRLDAMVEQSRTLAQEAPAAVPRAAAEPAVALRSSAV